MIWFWDTYKYIFYLYINILNIDPFQISWGSPSWNDVRLIIQPSMIGEDYPDLRSLDPCADALGTLKAKITTKETKFEVCVANSFWNWCELSWSGKATAVPQIPVDDGTFLLESLGHSFENPMVSCKCSFTKDDHDLARHLRTWTRCAVAVCRWPTW